MFCRMQPRTGYRGVSNFLNALLERGSEGGNPARVALKGATENQLLGHNCGVWLERGVDGDGCRKSRARN